MATRQNLSRKGKPDSSRAHARPSASRRVAFEILLRVETEASFASELLNGPLTAEMEERDASLATDLVMGTLRWQAPLDFLARQFAHRWESLDPEVRVALRMGLYQLRFLCRVPGRMPARAAIYETVEIVKAAGKRSAAGLVNAVLRRSEESASRSQESEGGRQKLEVRSQKLEEVQANAFGDLASLRPAAMPEMEWLGIEHSHPAWMLERWIARSGREAALELACANNQAPATFLRWNLAALAGDEIEKELERQGIALRPGNLLITSRALAHGNITRTNAWRRGDVVVQDEASQAVAYLLDVNEGQRVLDLCAAPGNKTAQLAAQAGKRGWIVACDIHLHRLHRLKQMAAIPQESNVQRMVLDGERPLPFGASFDRVLVDAPCSGTGTLRRHPEIKWRLKPTDIAILAEKQLRLLHQAASVLAPGGRMVYSVCSLEDEEGRGAAEKFLASHAEFRLVPLREDAARLRAFFQPAVSAILDGDYFSTSPARGGCDGFFAAIFVKDSNHIDNGCVPL